MRGTSLLPFVAPPATSSLLFLFFDSSKPFHLRFGLSPLPPSPDGQYRLSLSLAVLFLFGLLPQVVACAGLQFLSDRCRGRRQPTEGSRLERKGRCDRRMNGRRKGMGECWCRRLQICRRITRRHGHRWTSSIRHCPQKGRCSRGFICRV